MWRVKSFSLGRALQQILRSEIPGVLFGLLAIYVVFDPGLLTPDSTWILSQADSGAINDWLSPTPTWLLSTLHIDGRRWFYLTAIAFLLVTSRLLARVCSRLCAGFAAAAIALSPPVLGWLSGLGRDTTCAVALLGAVLLATGPPPSSAARCVGRVVALAATMWLALATRQNAALAVLGVACFAVAPYTGSIATRWRRGAAVLAGALASTVVLYAANSLLVSQVIHPVRTHPEQATYVADLAGMSIRTGEVLLPPTVWNGNPDVDRLAAVWDPADGSAVYNVEDPPIHTLSDPDAVDDLRRQWLRAIADHPLAYAQHRARTIEVVLFESTEIGDPFIPGMRGSLPGHDLARPRLAGDVIDLQGWFWRLSGLRVWHVLGAGLAAAYLLRRTRFAELAACLQVTGWLVVISLVPTTPASQYRYAWMPVAASLVTVALAAAHRWAGADGGPSTRTKPASNDSLPSSHAVNASASASKLHDRARAEARPEA